MAETKVRRFEQKKLPKNQPPIPVAGSQRNRIIEQDIETDLLTLVNTHTMAPSNILTFQKIMGNHAIQRMLKSKSIYIMDNETNRRTSIIQRDETEANSGSQKVQLGADTPISLNKLKGMDRKMASIYNEYGNYLTEKAGEIGIDVASAAAVLKVESGGHGFDEGTGQMIIRFENHVFHKLWGNDNSLEFAKHIKHASKKTWEGHLFRDDEKKEWETFHGDQSKEWIVLQFARALDDEMALRSISMGAAQIMGGNYQTVGYKSAREMFDQMSGGTASDQSAALSCPEVDPELRLLATKAQLDGLFAYIKSTKNCIDGLKEKDNKKFASGYNGAGQAEAYGNLISDAATAYTKVTGFAK